MVRDDAQTTKIKQETDLPPRRDTIQTSQMEVRRGERTRMMTDFFGQNIIITKIDGPQPIEEN